MEDIVNKKGINMSKLNKNEWVYRHFEIHQQEQGMHICGTAIYKETLNPEFVSHYINTTITKVIDDHEILLARDIKSSYSVNWETNKFAGEIWWKINSIHVSTHNLGEVEWNDSIPIDRAEQYDKEELYQFAQDMELEYAS